MSLVEKYSAAEDLFEYLAYDTDSFRSHSVSLLARRTRVDYYDLVKVLKQLDHLSIGTFIVGRKGNDTRVNWSFNSVCIGKVGLGKKHFLEPVPKNALDYDGPADDEFIREHEFYLRPDFKLKFELPSDFNRIDQNRLEKWLATIPFD